MIKAISYLIYYGWYIEMKVKHFRWKLVKTSMYEIVNRNTSHSKEKKETTFRKPFSIFSRLKCVDSVLSLLLSLSKYLNSLFYVIFINSNSLSVFIFHFISNSSTFFCKPQSHFLSNCEGMQTMGIWEGFSKSRKFHN